MPRDYKNTPRPRPRRPAPGWVWMLAGLAVGLFVALLVFLRGRYPTPEGRTPPARVEAPVHSRPAPVARATAGKRTAAATKAKAEAKAAPQPKFDFYTILPEMEVMVPDQDIGGPVEHGLPQVDTPGTYVLQAGSFRSYAQADRLKAKLALLGLEANIQSVTVNGDETWHRVRLGPFHSLQRLNRTRAALKRHHVEALLLKLKS